MKLIIVESPTKEKTLSRFLNKNYKIASTKGHIRDLPKSKLGVDVEKNFEPQYIIILNKRKTIKELKELGKKAETIILATDPDREGEAIAWHTAKVLELKDNDYQRIAFHEITKEALEEALKNPRKIDIKLVNAQQARRILDRIVGYKLSPFLWKKVASKLSAGRVQSVALRLVVEREREIKKFIPQEYWTIEAIFENSKKENLKANLSKIKGKNVAKFEIKTEKQAKDIIEDIKEGKYKIADVKAKETRKYPFPPFTTSTLQQEAWQKLRIPSKTTMQIAQNLYEQGLITYHRSDSLSLSQQSVSLAKKFIEEKIGKNYYPGKPKFYKTRSKTAQEAHEAIRPTDPFTTPVFLKTKEKSFFHKASAVKLYSLIWKRFIASQMKEAVFNSITVEIETEGKSKNAYLFLANGQTLKFDGFLKVYPIKYEETLIPVLEKGEDVFLIKIDPLQHFTQPPARYSEASLIKDLEKYGIGRPSTYALIISLIQQRNYVQKDDQKRFYPTDVGMPVNDILVEHFPEIVDIDFTAKMENELDEIAEGKREGTAVLKEFYLPFEKNLIKKQKEVEKINGKEETDKTCPKCDSPMLLKMSRFGRFYGCSKFPECKYTESLEKQNLGIKCPKCQKGEIVEKRTRKQKIFYGCSRWPECDFALWDKPTGKTCPKCGSLIAKNKRGKESCSNKDCKN